MASIPDIAGLTDCASSAEAVSAASPFTAVNYHFGMLLGVDDFETEQAFAHGKMRLHNAWLHREGVVWGFGVEADLPSAEIRVEPGLALDPVGRELHLDARACVNVGAWYDAHRDDPDLSATEGAGGDVSFDAHVIARFRACLTRPVPAFADPCEAATSETAYSRIFETVELLLVPGLAPATIDPYHRLRLLFGLVDPDTEEGGAVTAGDQEVLDAVTDDVRALLVAFRRFAALDGIDLQPSAPGDAPDDESAGIFPAPDATPLVLANVQGITLHRAGDAWTLTAADVDPTVRATHVATRTIQELLCARGGAVAAGGAPVSLPPDAGGPRVDRSSVAISERTITMAVDKPVDAATVDPEAFRVASLGDSGWKHIKVASADFDEATSTVTLKLRTDPGADPVRITAQGTGINPIVGTDLVPLAGEVGGPPATQHEGIDFVHILKRS